MRFKLLRGTHTDSEGKTYKKNDYIVTDEDLTQIPGGQEKFKFIELSEEVMPAQAKKKQEEKEKGEDQFETVRSEIIGTNDGERFQMVNFSNNRAWCDIYDSKEGIFLNEKRLRKDQAIEFVRQKNRELREKLF